MTLREGSVLIRSHGNSSSSCSYAPQRYQAYTLVFFGILVVSGGYLLLLRGSATSDMLPVLVAAFGFCIATWGFVSYCQAERQMRGETRSRWRSDCSFVVEDHERLPEHLGREIRRKLAASTRYVHGLPFPPESLN